MKYLVDLNYTLVANSPKFGKPRLSPFTRQIEQEIYRKWLVDFLKDKYVILITARPQRYKDITLERIKALTDWQPQESYFAEVFASPPEIKEDLLKKYILPIHGKDGSQFCGIESNPKTRDMYVRYGIVSYPAQNFRNHF